MPQPNVARPSEEQVLHLLVARDDSKALYPSAVEPAAQDVAFLEPAAEIGFKARNEAKGGRTISIE